MHSYYYISMILMIKLCDKEICKHLHMIFVSSMEEWSFPLIWNMANVGPGHEKNDKRTIKNFRQFHFFQLLVKYMNAYSTTKCILSLLKIF